jgi:hypothetical protein
MELDNRDLVTVNLKYGSAATPRIVLAFSELCAKVIYLSNVLFGSSELAKKIAEMLGVRKVSQESLITAMSLLEELGKVRKRNDKWQLTPDARDEIASHISQRRKQLEEVLDKHFPESIDRDVLRSWFNEIVATVFGQYGDEWVASVCRGPRYKLSRLQALPNLIAHATSKHGLASMVHSLEAGFREFLRSDDLSDQDYLMSLGQAMFSARLVAADIAADPIALDEFRGATVIADTNLVFAFALEDHRLAKSVLALARALQSIGAEVVYLRITQEEYQRALEGVRGEVLAMIDVFPAEVVANAHNDFISTAQARACKTKEDFERFFDELSEFPSEIVEGVSLNIMENKEVEGDIEKAIKDENLKRRLKNLAGKLRPRWRREKSNLSLEHDAALIYVTQKERESGPYTMPTIISVDALVEILALESAGPSFDPTDLAPLLASIIINECSPIPTTYTIEDLQWMYGINQDVADLSPDHAKDIALSVSKARIEGARPGDRRLQLNVNRMFQAKREETEKKLRETYERLKTVEEDAQRVQAEKLSLEKKLVKHKTRDFISLARSRLRKRLFIRVPITFIGGILLWFLISWLTRGLESRDIISTIISLFFVVVFFCKFGWAPIMNYRQEVKSAEKRAFEEVHDISNSNETNNINKNK